MHFIFDLIRKILRGSLYGERVVLWGNGEQERELIHVGDFIEAMLQLVQTEANTWINVGSGQRRSIRQFAESICQIVDHAPSQIEYDVSRYVGAKSKVLNIQKLKQLLPAFAPRPLHVGLAEVVQWFQASGSI